MPQKYLKRLFGSRMSGSHANRVGPATGYINVSKQVRMVDSETQTTDDLLEDLLMEKLREAYERRR